MTDRLKRCKSRSSSRGNVFYASLVGLGFLSATMVGALIADAKSSTTFDHPTYSSSIAMSADNKLVWSVNPADGSVSVIRTDTNSLIKNIKVGQEPQSIALDPDNDFAYVANAAGSNVTVVKIVNPNPDEFQAEVDRQLTTGSEPWNIVVSPDGRRVFVATAGKTRSP